MGKRLQKQKKRYRKGSFFEVKKDYCFVEGHLGRRSDDPICFKRGDIAQVNSTYVSGDELGITMTFRSKDGRTGFDDTSPFFLQGVLRKMSRSEKKDREKIDKIFHREG